MEIVDWSNLRAQRSTDMRRQYPVEETTGGTRQGDSKRRIRGIWDMTLEELVLEIKKRSRIFTDDNYTCPTPSDYLHFAGNVNVRL
jgi:hypothetical protein